jgi:micrococcal nuclease
MVACTAPPGLPQGDSVCRAPTRVQVLDFVDGDTADVHFLEGALTGTEERIRLIGVDTPEINHSNTANSECYGVMAWNEATEQLEDQEAWLSYDEQCLDFFGRTLAYMSRRSDLFFLNEHLIEQGFGRSLSIPPSDQFSDEFALLESEAQEQGRGLWGEPCFGSTR